MDNKWKTTVLVIEDDELDARLIIERLSLQGRFKVHVSDNLADGIKQLSENNNFDAILLDLTLPDSQDIDTFEAIHSKVPHLPIIILTGLDDDAVVLHTLKNGAQDYLLKGQVTTHLLERTIRYAIERKQFEEALIKNKLQLDEAMECAQLYQWEFDIKEGAFLFNEKLLHFFGRENSSPGVYKISADEYSDNYIYSKDKYVFEQEVNNAFNTSNPNYTSQIEYRILRQDGQIRHILVRTKVRLDENSKPFKFFGIIQDISERKIALQQAYEALNQIDKTKTEFLYFISQEIRTPLNSVICAVNMFKNQENSAAMRDLVETLDHSVSNLESFTNNTILYTKLTNIFKLNISEFKMKDLIRFALLEKENLFKNKEIAVSFERSDDILLRADKDLFYCLFTNLLEIFAFNSIVKNTINIEIDEEGDRIICNFKDSRSRFSEELLKTYSSVAGIYKNYQMGLSLYIAKLILEKHNGELRIFNENDIEATARLIIAKL